MELMVLSMTEADLVVQLVAVGSTERKQRCDFESAPGHKQGAGPKKEEMREVHVKYCI